MATSVLLKSEEGAPGVEVPAAGAEVVLEVEVEDRVED